MKFNMKVLIFTLAAIVAVATIHNIYISGVFNNTTLFLAVITLAILGYGYFFDRLKKMNWLTAAIIAGIAVTLAFSAFLDIYGRRTTATFDEDVVIVMGAGSRDYEPLSTLARRLDAAVSYHQQNPDALIIVSGGTGHQATMADAYIMAQYLIDRGVDPNRIALEGMAYSTYANMRYSREVMQAYFANEHPVSIEEKRVVIITSDFHMYRSVRFARQVGLTPTMYPASVPWYAIPLAYVREVASVIKMWLIGR